MTDYTELKRLAEAEGGPDWTDEKAYAYIAAASPAAILALIAENETLRLHASLQVLLPDLDYALESLEMHGRHSDQGYRQLKDWYRKMSLMCGKIDAAAKPNPT